MKKIYIAPSNQNANPYYGGQTNEAEQCRKVAMALGNCLSAYECETMIGKDNETLSTKCANAKSWGADIYVSIHSNGFNGTVMGTEAWYCSTDRRADQSKRLAQLINNEMAKIFPTNRGLKTSSSLYECSVPAMPSTICEMGFHDNKYDAEIIVGNTDRLADAFCSAIVGYLDLKKKDVEPEKKGDLVIENIGNKKVVLNKDANLWNLDFKTWAEACPVKEYKKGEIIEVSAVAIHPLGSKYYLTEYSYSKGINNGFNVVDCDDYEEPTQDYTPKAGDRVVLYDCPLYATATTKKVATDVSGTYYLWSAGVVNGRIRITNKPDRVGVSGQVTGWIDTYNI